MNNNNKFSDGQNGNNNYDLNYVDSPSRERIVQSKNRIHLDDRELSVSVLHNAAILPVTAEGGGIVNNEGSSIKSSALTANSTVEYAFNNTEYNEDTVIYIGHMHHLWGHCITDCLKFIWYITLPDVRKRIVEEKIQIVYIAAKGYVFPPNFIRLLSSLGINVNTLVRIDVATRFATLILPDESFYCDIAGNRYYTKKYIETIDTITKNIVSTYEGPIYAKIYFSRTRYIPNKDVGEKSIENVFHKLGYKVIYPEKINFEEEVAILNGCETFASTEGSISHNAVFCHQGANIITIRKHDFVYDYQLAINEIRNLHVTYIDAHLSAFLDKEHPWTGPFFLYVNNNMIRFAKDQGLIIAEKSFPSRRFKHYVLRCLPNEIYSQPYYAKQVSQIYQLKQLRFRYFISKFILLLHIKRYTPLALRMIEKYKNSQK